ncbi:MAG: hypothetical protein OEM07_05050 [Gammaproteobacteria bacterium]|nr:hypothetical protein [Gammaproteobacteria bacterium]
MLQEIASTHRSSHRKPKRWFTDSDMDLFIWFEKQRPVCFQLSYDKRQHEHSISWHIDAGFSHSSINAETRHTKYQQPKSSSSTGEPNFNSRYIAREFLLASQHIQTSIADFIFARLIEYPDQSDKCPDQSPASKSL